MSPHMSVCLSVRIPGIAAAAPFAAIVAALVTSLAWTGQARADAALSSVGETVFPDAIDIAVEVRAQVETTTVLFSFADVLGGDYVLTVPSPEGAYSVGVDIDQGAGFVPLAMTDEAPPPGVGAGSGDPAVTAWQGHTALLADLAAIAPGPLTARVTFLRTLRRYQGQVAFAIGAARCPLRDVADPGPTLTLTATVETLRPRAEFTALPSAQTTAALDPVTSVDSELRVRVDVAAHALDGASFLDLVYAQETPAISAHFLAHRTADADPLGGQDGFFMLVVDADEVNVEDTQPRTLQLVIDRSGSMGGDKIAQARDAARAMLDHLRETDEFNIVVFDSDVSAIWSEARAASAGNIDAARDFIKDIDAGGSTNLDGAIIRGLGGSTDPDEARANARFDAMVLLSDGQATCGETDPSAIHDHSIAYNGWRTRIYTVAVGFGADIPLMEALSRSSRGQSFLLNETQAVSELVATAETLFEDIYAVRLEDMNVGLTGLSTSAMLPENPPDLFNGGQVLIVGRYQNAGDGSVQVSGDAAGLPYELELPVAAPETEAGNEFIKYVWATQRVGQLLSEMAMGGDRDELRAEITELGLAYRIQTPFTSFSSAPGAGFADSASAGSGCRTSPAHDGGTGALTGAGLLALLGLLWLRRRRSWISTVLIHD